MEVQGNILKTLLIVAVVYTLALGAPVKRDISSSTVAKACAAANDLQNLTQHNETTTINCTCGQQDLYDACILARELKDDLKRTQVNFREAVRESVVKCFNSDGFNKSCQLAIKAITLQDAINKFLVQVNLVKPYCQVLTQSVNYCSRNTTEVDAKVEEKLYVASTCTLKCLGKLDEASYTICSSF